MRLTCKCKTLMDGPFILTGRYSEPEPNIIIGFKHLTLPGFNIVVTANTYYQCPACGERLVFEEHTGETNLGRAIFGKTVSETVDEVIAAREQKQKKSLRERLGHFLKDWRVREDDELRGGDVPRQSDIDELESMLVAEVRKQTQSLEEQITALQVVGSTLTRELVFNQACLLLDDAHGVMFDLQTCPGGKEANDRAENWCRRAREFDTLHGPDPSNRPSHVMGEKTCGRFDALGVPCLAPKDHAGPCQNVIREKLLTRAELIAALDYAATQTDGPAYSAVNALLRHLKGVT